MNDNERKLWVNNDESLYSWWRSSGLSLTAFIRQNRGAITDYIERQLNRLPGDSSYGVDPPAPALPAGWHTMQLSEILPASAISVIEEAHRAGTLNLTKLKFVCRRYAGEIRARGNDPDYIAYALANALHTSLGGLGAGPMSVNERTWFASGDAVLCVTFQEKDEPNFWMLKVTVFVNAMFETSYHVYDIPLSVDYVTALRRAAKEGVQKAVDGHVIDFGDTALGSSTPVRRIATPSWAPNFLRGLGALAETYSRLTR
jgi:hypothetical protein